MCTQRQPNKICESMYRLLDQAIEEYIRDVILNALTVCIKNNGNLLLVSAVGGDHSVVVALFDFYLFESFSNRCYLFDGRVACEIDPRL